MAVKNNWIAKAIKKPGSFTRTAKRSGKTVSGMISAVNKNPGKYSATTRRRANLAKTLSKMNKKK